MKNLKPKYKRGTLVETSGGEGANLFGIITAQILGNTSVGYFLNGLQNEVGEDEIVAAYRPLSVRRARRTTPTTAKATAPATKKAKAATGKTAVTAKKKNSTKTKNTGSESAAW